MLSNRVTIPARGEYYKKIMKNRIFFDFYIVSYIGSPKSFDAKVCLNIAIFRKKIARYETFDL